MKYLLITIAALVLVAWETSHPAPLTYQSTSAKSPYSSDTQCGIRWCLLEISWILYQFPLIRFLYIHLKIFSLLGALFFAALGCVCLYKGIKLAISDWKKEKPKHSKNDEWIRLLPLIISFLLFYFSYLVVVPKKWICRECKTYQADQSMLEYKYAEKRYACINCDKKFRGVNSFRDRTPFYSLP